MRDLILTTIGIAIENAACAAHLAAGAARHIHDGQRRAQIKKSRCDRSIDRLEEGASQGSAEPRPRAPFVQLCSKSSRLGLAAASLPSSRPRRVTQSKQSSRAPRKKKRRKRPFGGNPACALDDVVVVCFDEELHAVHRSIEGLGWPL